ncbi:MAG: sugar phosphate isomerase/epimerase [Clostridia bacterium]|nr:sugar phosphate isomerase/epimerase [Clostridia bacterium]
MRVSLAPIALRAYRGDPGQSAFKEGIRSLLWRVRQIGFDGIEMGTPPTFTNAEYKDCLDALGLEAVTAGSLSSEALAAGDFADTLTQCKVLGAKNVMIPCLPAAALGNPYELDSFIGQLNRAGRALMDAGVHLSYHNHAVDFSRVNDKTILERIVEETDPACVFIEPDTHWIQAGGGHVISWLKRLRGRVYIVHFKDYGIDPYSDHAFLEGTHKLFMEFGEGNLNWPGILKECLAQNIAWCSLEQDECQRPPYEAAALGLKNLRDTLQLL